MALSRNLQRHQLVVRAQARAQAQARVAVLELELELRGPIPTTGKVERVAGWARAVVELHEHAPGRSNPRASARVACFGAHSGRIRFP